MFDRHISTSDATPVSAVDMLGMVESTLSSLETFAVAEHRDVATQHDFSLSPPRSLAERYAAANSITRRRCDAILREAEGVARTGLGLVMARADRHDRATIAAARFLGNRIAGSIRRLENLLSLHAA
jgi:hypothetical protein